MEESTGETGESFDIAAFAPYLLNRLVAVINVDYRRSLHRRRLTLNHWRVLAALQRRQPLLAGELADITGTDPTTLSRLLSRMEERGLIDRRQRAGDGRYVEVWLTAAGRATFDDLLPLARLHGRQALAGLDADEEVTLQRLLVKALDPFGGLSLR